jgi:NTP pyrophosphatase (non-canonical NTP hydrolase)
MVPPKEAKIVVHVDPMFSGLYVLQQDFQARLLKGQHPANLSNEEKMQYLRTQALALTDELHEALGETGWKDWTTSNHINRDAYKGELADVFIFLMNLMLVGDITPTDLMDAAKAKIAKNHKRQDDGYNGVTEKCPGCRRAYDDDAVTCTPDGCYYESPQGVLA